ncbi:MAG: hypothetical protein JXQ96_06630 [Cyclobacteriaceae bacterium]
MLTNTTRGIITVKQLRFLLIISIFFSISWNGYGNGITKENRNSLDHAFTLLLNISETPNFHQRDMLHASYDQFVDALVEKKIRWNNDKRFLEHLFYKVHRKYLKKYVAYQSFQELFDYGTYGCLTGTALYAFLLSELGYEYEIIETNYHMFLLVHAGGKRYLMESTDPFAGFEYKSAEIEKRISAAQEQNKTGGKYHTFSYNIYRSISYDDLIGLQYYNTAINAYNKGKLGLALYCLNESARLNQSERIKEFLHLMIDSVDNQLVLQNAILKLDELSDYLVIAD